MISSTRIVYERSGIPPSPFPLRVWGRGRKGGGEKGGCVCGWSQERLEPSRLILTTFQRFMGKQTPLVATVEYKVYVKLKVR